jgi:site-specific recombinase XerD
MKVNLEKELQNLCTINKDGSYSTQYHRRKILTQAASDLKSLGFYNLSPQGIKPKHVEKLVEHWKESGIKPASIKNRMSHLRWWAQKVNKSSIIARSNDHYGIEKRKYVTNESKAIRLSKDEIKAIKDERIRTSVELQNAFGLRREECLKFQPSYAIKEDKIVLKASWTKGGKARQIPIRNQQQRDVLEKVSAIAGKGSMIPSEYNYRQWLNRYTKQLSTAGLSKLHGLRHQYAQDRYLELTGRECPAKGGLTARQLSKEQKQEDLKARLTISKELGHEREAITAVYLGR